MNYKSVRRKRVIKYLEKLGFHNYGGHSHDKFLIPNMDKEPVIVPRHARDLSPGVIDQISKILAESYQVNKTDVLNNLK